MTGVADVSLCVITKDEPYLEQALRSIRPFVAQICVVVTGGTISPAERLLIDKIEKFDGINPELGCFDFSLARNRSFGLASMPYILWMDADDEITGGENLQKEVEFLLPHGPQAQSMFPYDYSFDRLGNCTCTLFRERLMPNTRQWFWDEPVHEAILPIGNRHSRSALRWVHHKNPASVRLAHGRNLTILRKSVEKNPTARNVYYLGVACADGDLVEEAVKWLTQFSTMSNYEDELHNAFSVLSNLNLRLGKLDDAVKWAWKSIEAKERWFESYFTLSRCYYYRAQKTGDRRDWERCVRFGELALEQPPTQSFQPTQPMLRAHEIYVWMTVAYDNLCDPPKALAMAQEGLKAVPDDGGLLFNALLLGAAVSRQQLATALEDLTKARGKEPAVDKLIDEAFTNAVRMMGQGGGSNQNGAAGIDANGAAGAAPAGDGGQVAAWRILHEVPASLDIVFACGDGWVPWDPESIREKGFGGGSEAAVVEMARRLVGLGHHVRVYNPCVREGNHEGVEYLKFQRMGTEAGTWRSESGRVWENVKECDVLIAWRVAGFLTKFDAHLKLLWLHDICAWGAPGRQATTEEILVADFVLCVSEWHRQYVHQNQGVPLDRIVATRNGIARPERFDKHLIGVADGEYGSSPEEYSEAPVERDLHKVIYNSSPDRGLETLLDLWSAIRKEVPDASLHIFYGFETWKKMGHNADAAARIEQKMIDLGDQGVVYRGRVPPEELALAMVTAGCWFYPNWGFAEVSCVAAMEAQLAGLRVVSSDLAALVETVKWGRIVRKPEHFFDAAILALKDEGEWGFAPATREKQSALARDAFSLDTLTANWIGLFKGWLAERVAPVELPSYEGVMPMDRTYL